MTYSVKNGWHPPVGQFTRKSDATQLAKQMRDANKQAGIRGAVKVVRSNPGRKNPTKAQKREKTRKVSAKRRVAVALAKFLKHANPAMKTAGASIQRLKGGVIKITPIKANAGGLGRVLSEYGHQRRGGTPRLAAVKRAIRSTRKNPKRGRM